MNVPYILEQLRQRGCAVGVLSNSTGPFVRFPIALNNYFDAYLPVDDAQDDAFIAYVASEYNRLRKGQQHELNRSTSG